MDGDRRRPLRWTGVGWSAGQDQHRLSGLGRHRLSKPEEREEDRQRRAGLKGPFPQTARKADAGAEAAGEQRPLKTTLWRRACPSPIKNTTCASSSGLSGSQEPKPKSAWQTSPTTCAASCSGKPKPPLCRNRSQEKQKPLAINAPKIVQLLTRAVDASGK